jgi:hypothetical protein
MTSDLPPGLYPFAFERLPLDRLRMAEVPPEMQVLFVESASRNGLELIRDRIVELRCQMPDGEVATFTVWWPEKESRMHMLVPREHVEGTA